MLIAVGHAPMVEVKVVISMLTQTIQFTHYCSIIYKILVHQIHKTYTITKKTLISCCM